MISTCDSRLVYIDESGDADRCCHLSAVSVPTSALADIEKQVDLFYARFTTFFNLASDYELHGVRLVRTKGAPNESGHLRLYEREFLYRHALEFCSELPSIRLHVVSWDWAPHPRRVQGCGRLFRDAKMYSALFDWIAESPERIDAVTVDGLNNQAAKICYERYVKKNGHQVFTPTSPHLVSSNKCRLVQFADLFAYAGFRALQHKALPERLRSNRDQSTTGDQSTTEHDRWVIRLHDWYNLTATNVAAKGGWHYAMRTHVGETQAVPTKSAG